MKKFAALIVGITVVNLGCNTIPTPFTRTEPNYENIPVADLRELATEIEVAIAEGNRAPDIKNRNGLVVETEAIRQAIRTRAIRYEYIDEFRDTGHAWERRNGRLWIIRSEQYRRESTGRERDRDAAMVVGENENRWTLYEELIDESDLPRGAMSAIQEIFFEARVPLLKSGQKYEDENGEVAIKP